jgi:two-component system cell cycle sensor histidine kinase/response regulator CckA
MGKKKSPGKSVDRPNLPSDLPESEARYRMLVEMSIDGIAIVRDDRIIYFNNRMIEATGYTRQELQNLPFHEFIHPDDRAMVIEQYHRGLADEVSSGTLEFRALTKDGTPLYTEINAVRAEWEGSPAVLCFFRDISERKAAERALAESEQRYRDMVENIEDIIYVMDDKGRFVFFNKALEKFSGLTRDEILSVSFTGIITPESLKRVGEIYRRQLAGQDVGTFEMEFRNKKGEIITLEARERVIWKEDRAVEVHGIGRDITERKRTETALRESEERYRALYEDNPSMYFTIDGVGTVLSVNPFGAEQLGYTIDELVGHPVLAIFHQDDKDAVTRQMRACLENPGQVARWEFRKVRKDGSVLWVREAARAVRRADGTPVIFIVCEDITEHKRAEEALRESEERYRGLVDVSPDAVVVHSEGKVVFLNAAATKLLGARVPEDIIGKPAFDFVHPDYRAIIAERVRKALADGTPAPLMQEKFIRTDGTVIDGEVAAIPLTYQSKPAMLVVVRDVSDRKRAEEALIARERALNNIFEFTGTATIIVEEDATISKCNHEFEKLSGYKREEIEGKQSWTVFVHPDDVDRAKGFFDAGGEGDPSGRAGHEFRFINRDGIVKYIHLTVGLIPETKQSVAAFLDISDRRRSEDALRQSEEKFRNLFDTSQDVIFLSTTSGWFYDINRAGEELFGYTRDELLNLDIQDIYKDRMERQRFQKTIEDLGFVKDYEVTFKRKDGTFVDCLITATLRPDRDGNIIGYQGIIRDVSERKKITEQLAAAAKMEAVGTLAGGMAHNFNNILVGIMGYSEFLLGRKDRDDPDYKALKIIHEGTVRASKLTGELLSIARGGEYNLVKFSVNTLIEKFLPLITGTFDKSIEISTHTDPRLPVIEGDMNQIEQCLLNLCINARDAMPNGGRLIIETHLQHVDEDFVRMHLDARIGDYVVLSVTDTGHGIEPKTLPHIFEPFFTTKEHKQGSGLGLSTVWGITKNHRGLITVYSAPNEGSTFKLYFPALAEEAAEPVAPHQVGETFGNETILLIDDEPIVREMWGDALMDEGYRVITAEDGVEGIGIFIKEKDAIDLIILDFIMPGLGGRETFVRLREIRPDAKIIICSGYSTNGKVKDAIGEDADGFIQKPCQLKHLAEKVREVLSET